MLPAMFGTCLSTNEECLNWFFYKYPDKGWKIMLAAGYPLGKWGVARWLPT